SDLRPTTGAPFCFVLLGPVDLVDRFLGFGVSVISNHLNCHAIPLRHLKTYATDKQERRQQPVTSSAYSLYGLQLALRLLQAFVVQGVLRVQVLSSVVPGICRRVSSWS